MPGETNLVPDPLVGRRLGEFTLKEKLGEGGFGAVYRAEQINLSREAAVKILRIRHKDNIEKIERFKREAKLASRLEHPYASHIYAFGTESDGLMWIAMELIRGTALDQLLKLQGQLPLERFVPLLEKICEVVHTAHEAGIIHRDIKPANVMVISRAGRLLPKLLDFGIAKDFDRPSSKSSKKEIVQINPDPELFNNSTDLSDTPTESLSLIIDIKNVAKDIYLQEQTESGEFLITNKQISKTFLPSSIALGTNIDLSIENIEKANKANTIDSQELTQEFSDALTLGIVGSPPYMSCEQWLNDVPISAQSDIYSLGVLSYEVLTGHKPFLESSLLEMSLAHLTKPVPSLGKNFPVALDQVISKAMAKQPSERYSTTLEFVTAFRQACGFKDKQELLPQIDKEVQESFLTKAPQPLAQSLASLANARNFHQLKEDLLELFRLLVHYLAILSLASYQQTSLAQSSQSQVITDLLKKLYKEKLTLKQWLELVKEISNQFKSHPDAFPIPELVTLFFTSNDSRSDIFEPFLAAQELFRGKSVDSTEGVELLTVKLAQMTEILTSLKFLQDYRLVIVRDGFIEEKTGLHSKREALIASPNQHFNLGEALLVNSSNNPILKLSPLVKIAPPFPGANEEIFLFAGRNRYGGRFIAWPSGFEFSDDTPLEWINENIFDIFDSQIPATFLEKTPYLGLQSFTNNDVDLFYGREKETSVFINRMCSQPLLAVVGPSGAGKSSFVQAGIIAKLSSEWLPVTIRPGANPLTTLCSQLIKAGLKLNLSSEEIKSNPELLSKALCKCMIEIDKKLLLVIDQLEELFSLCLDLNERQSFALTLAQISCRAEDPLRTVLTLRDDFLIRAEQLPGLRERLSSSLYLLATPSKEQLLRILVRPAQDYGYEFEDEKLAEEIVNDVISQSAALALLAFTAAKLWDLRDRQFKKLRRKAYESMGKVGGALATHAEEMMSQMTQDEQNLVREIMRRLVTSEKTRAVIAKEELTQVLEKGTEKVLEKLIVARLLVTYEGENAIEKVEIIHEALLTAWPRLIKWQQEDIEGTRLRDQIQIAARQWHERSKPKGLLWRDEALIELELWQSKYKIKLTEKEEEFTKASISEAYKSKIRNRALLTIVLTVLTFGSITLFWQRTRIKTQKDEIQKQILNFYQEQGREELLKGDTNRALIYLSRAYSQGDDSDSLRLMLTQALSNLENREPITLKGHTEQVRTIAFSPDSAKIASGSTDTSIIIWDIEKRQIIKKLTDHQTSINSLDFSPDGKKIISGSNDQTIKIWDAVSYQLLDTIKFNNTVSTVAFSSDSRQFAVVCNDSKTDIFDTESKKLIFSLEGHKGIISTVVYSPDGKQILTSSQDGTAKIWQANDGKLVATLSSHKSLLTSASFSSDGQHIVTTSNDHTLKIWEVSTTKLLNTLEVDKEQVYFAEFSKNNKQLISIGQDKNLKIWEIPTNRQLLNLKGHESIVRLAKYSPNQKYIATAGYDKTIKLWNISFDDRPSSEVEELIKNKVPLRLVGEQVVALPKKDDAKKDDSLPSAEMFITNKFSPKSVPLTLEKFQFQTATTNNLGKIISKETLEREQYKENLGDGVFLYMVSIPGGTFIIGSSEKEGNEEEKPQVEIQVKPFFMGKFEITQAIWQFVMGYNPSYIKDDDNLPVDTISWEDAMLFCERLSQLTGRTYRLPTEAEWEYAARSGTTTRFAFGDNISPEIVNYDGLSPLDSVPKGLFRQKTVPVGSLGFANKFGLYDMHGNAFEWCLDVGSDNYKEIPTDGTSRETPYNLSRVLRGGAWYYSASEARSAARGSTRGTSKLKVSGFRVVYRP